MRRREFLKSAGGVSLASAFGELVSAAEPAPLDVEQAKGRLQHALRVSGSPTPFSRKVSVGPLATTPMTTSSGTFAPSF
ncbi:MAG: hypothetical protein ACQESR_17250 [Planctomycetota bacterium]